MPPIKEISERVRQLTPSLIRVMFAKRRATSIDLTVGEPMIPPDADLVERAVVALRSGPQGYTENAGMPQLREAIARHYAFPDRDRAENAIITVGSQEAIFLAMISTLDVGDEILLPELSFPPYANIARMIGATIVPYPIARETGLVARAAAIEPLITPQTRVVLLGSPSNPFGTVDDRAELERIAALVERHGLIVISDEIYRDIVYGDAYPLPTICTMTKNAIFVGGLSKSCSMTGFRLGYLIASANQIKHIVIAHQSTVLCPPRISQLLALEVFKEPQRLRAQLGSYEAARAALLEAAKSLPADAPLLLGPGAFYGIIDVSRYANGDSMALALDLLDKEDVVVVPGVGFGPTGEWFWRVSYSCGPDTSREGVTRIARFLNDCRR